MAMPSSTPLRRNKTPANLFRTTMKRFLNKRSPEPLSSNEDALNALSAAPPPQPSPPLKKSGTSRWRRTRKQTEPLRAVTPTLALPSNDDFRTSLFMPGLSARFSMLREQDDPNSMLGKASDDSVLQPRRRSRMDFGLPKTLDDIAEVSSTKSAKSSIIRPPFADKRQDSFATDDGYQSETDSVRNGSVLNRARPGEGNTMFGGRQKVYMIPKAGTSSSRSLGRVVYEDDIGTSAFRKYRQQRAEQETRPSEESHGFDFGLDQTEDQDDWLQPTPNDSAKDLSHSSSLSSSEKKRSTNSTSHSEARSSTAATSITSQPTIASSSPAKPASSAATSATPSPSTQALKRSDTKTRRLYEQGLDQHMHEQQTSALSRLNSIHRQRTLTNKQSPPALHSTKSASNLREKTRQPVFALSGQDPPPTAPLLGGFGAFGLPGSNSASPLPSPLPHLTPQQALDLEENHALTQALEPGDRGKATAMGAFNKPKQSFDEEQYAERQRQLQRSASTAAVRKASAPVPQPDRLDGERASTESDASERSTSRSAAREHEPTTAYNVFQRAAQQINAKAGAEQPDKAALPDTHRTFFGNISASDSEDEDEHASTQPAFRVPDYGYGTQHGRWQPTVLPSVSEHPALRGRKSKTSLAGNDDKSSIKSSQLLRASPRIPGVGDPLDSPTLGGAPQSTTLNSLMQHLRQRSNVSSTTQNTDRTSTIEVPEQTELSAKNLDLVNQPIQSMISLDSRVGGYANSNPWDLDEAENAENANGVDNRVSRASVSPIDSEQRGGLFGSSESSYKKRHSAVSDLCPETPATDTENPWQNDLETRHTRDTSLETQQDRDAFDNELAARANAIQANLKTKVERENHSRGVSPASSAGGRKGFGMLRSRPSRESIENGRISHEAPPRIPSKALKLLGASSGAVNLQNGPTSEGASRPPLPSLQTRSFHQNDHDARRGFPSNRSRENSESAVRSPTSSAGQRSRANSAATNGRSRSRTGPYRDDLEKAMVEGTGSSAAVMPELGPMGPRELTPRSTPESTQNPFDPPRARNGSRSATTNYFEAKSLHSLQTGSSERLTPGMPSPAIFSPVGYSPLASPASRSPAGSFAHNMTPPLSGTTTPSQSTFGAPSQNPVSSGRPAGALRKKTISKGDISEPTLICSTSNIDLVDLPDGASLRNGMEDAPPVPPINPARRATKRILGLARKESDENTSIYGRRSKTPDAASRRSPEPDFDFPFDAVPSNRSRSDTLSPQKSNSSRSPEKMDRSPPRLVAMDGSMF